MSMSQDQIRREAVRRLNAKRNFWRMAGGFLILFLFFTAIWWLTPNQDGQHTHFWPIWPALGLGIALAFSGFAAYGPSKGITDAEIDAEMRRIRGQ